MQKEEKSVLIMQRLLRGYIGRRRFRKFKANQQKEAIRSAYVKERKAKDAKEAWLKEMEETEMRSAFRENQDMEAKVQEARMAAELARLNAEITLYQQQATDAAAGTWVPDDPSNTAAYWEEVYDDYGYVYYYNSKTGESSWDAPGVWNMNDYANEDQSGQSHTAVWEEIYDEWNQTTYYHHAVTGESVWERPAEMDFPVQAASYEQQQQYDPNQQQQYDPNQSYNSNAAYNDQHDGYADQSHQAVTDMGYNTGLETPAAWEEQAPAAWTEPAPAYQAENYPNYENTDSYEQPGQYEAAEVQDSTWNQEQVHPYAEETAYPTDDVYNEQAEGLEDYTEEQTPEVYEAPPPEMCWRCFDTEAVKTCVDCEDNHTLYCSKCYMTEHRAGAKRRHAFKILHTSLLTSSAYCGQCGIPATHQCNSCEKEFRFYCKDCFEGYHVTDDLTDHAFFQFRSGSVFCVQCDDEIARRFCKDCDDKYCLPCFENVHRKGKRKNHIFEELNVLKEELGEFDEYCVECEVKKCAVMCNLCGDGYCQSCYDIVHSKGNKKSHTVVAWSEVVKMGDWIEIDDSDQFSMTSRSSYFNVITKEMRDTKPSIMLSGLEKHTIQLDDTLNLKNKVAMEAESELITLRERVGQLEEEKRLGLSGTVPLKDESVVVKKTKGLFQRVLSRPIASSNSQTNTKKDDETALVKAMIMTPERASRLLKVDENIGSDAFKSSAVKDLIQ